MFPKILTLYFLASIAVYKAGASPFQSFFPWDHGSDNKNLNWVLDDILKSVKSELIVEHGDELVIANSQLNATKEVEILWIKINAGAVSTAPGLLKNISSVVRVSDAVISQTNNGGSSQIELKAELKLNDLEMVYSSVKAKLGFLSYDGGLTVNCPTNSFDIDVLITSGSSCSTKLVSASISDLACKLSLNNGGIMNFFKKYLLSYGMSKVIDDVKSTMTAQLPTILTPILEKHNVCKFLEPSS